MAGWPGLSDLLKGSVVTCRTLHLAHHRRLGLLVLQLGGRLLGPPGPPIWDRGQLKGTACVSGSIPATGRKDARTSGVGSAGATAAAAAAAAMLHQQSTGATAATSAVQPVVSAPTSIPFNQLIGGAVSPNVLAAAAAAGAPQPAATNLVIGDYVQSNLGYVLNSNASAAANVLRQ